jgi:hypothetical protein
VYLYNRAFVSVAVQDGVTVGDFLELLLPKLAAKSYPVERLSLYVVENDVGAQAAASAGAPGVLTTSPLPRQSACLDRTRCRPRYCSSGRRPGTQSTRRIC